MKEVRGWGGAGWGLAATGRVGAEGSQGLTVLGGSRTRQTVNDLSEML